MDVESQPDQQPVEDGVTVVDGGWHLVESDGWSVSVGPDGLLMLPRHITPEELAPFMSAMQKAAKVGARVKAQNEAAAKRKTRTPAEQFVSTVLVSASGQVPEGAIRLTAGDSSTIGRRGK